MKEVRIGYEIWQVRDEHERRYSFRRYDDLVATDGFFKENYYKVYIGEYVREESDVVLEEFGDAYVKCRMLDELYAQFNIDRPSNFRGHSMSVGDVVVVNSRAYYCDDVGWREVDFTETYNR